jgi:threonine dehydratase
MIPTQADLDAAAERVARYAHRTPVFTGAWFDERTGARVFFKAENLQRVGAFKFRGACNAVFSLDEAEARRGVLTHSSGNHAQAVALAARLRGVPAWVVMPEGAPAVKVQAVEGYGARVVRCAPTLAAREATAAELARETGAAFIHPYDDARVICGQSTAARELLEQAGPLDVVLAPVGGGGLLAGTALAAPSGTRVIGVEPAAADDAARSFHGGTLVPADNPRTIADGLRTSLGVLPFAIIRGHVADIVTVGEEEIIAAMRHVWERLKLVIEPSSAVPVAALLAGRVDVAGRRVGVILSGGNVDLDHLPWLR